MESHSGCLCKILPRKLVAIPFSDVSVKNAVKKEENLMFIGVFWLFRNEQNPLTS